MVVPFMCKPTLRSFSMSTKKFNRLSSHQLWAQPLFKRQVFAWEFQQNLMHLPIKSLHSFSLKLQLTTDAEFWAMLFNSMAQFEGLILEGYPSSGASSKFSTDLSLEQLTPLAPHILTLKTNAVPMVPAHCLSVWLGKMAPSLPKLRRIALDWPFNGGGFTASDLARLTQLPVTDVKMSCLQAVKETQFSSSLFLQIPTMRRMRFLKNVVIDIDLSTNHIAQLEGLPVTAVYLARLRHLTRPSSDQTRIVQALLELGTLRRAYISPQYSYSGCGRKMEYTGEERDLLAKLPIQDWSTVDIVEEKSS